MELKREVVLFINLVYRVILLIGFLSENEAPNLPVKDPIYNWNYALTDRVVLFLVNGLRDDFLERNSTPFLGEIAAKKGTFAVAEVESFLGAEAGLKVLLTGVPAHSSLFFWNRPSKYKTILDFIACKCVIGKLPLEKTPQCYYPEFDVFSTFKLLIDAEENKECLYVISYDFGGFFEEEYQDRLRSLDEDVEAIAKAVAGKWKDSRTTFVLTSGRGWSLWNRTDGDVNVPVLVWGEAILPVRQDKCLRLVDVPVLVSSLLGRSFPAGCMGQIPTYFLNATSEAKFHMMLYNNEHFEKTMSELEEDDVFELRSLEGFVEDEDAVSLRISVETFLENVSRLGLTRMKFVSATTVLSFLLWGLVFTVVIVRGTFVVELPPCTLAFIGVAAVATLACTTQSVIQNLLLEVLVPIVVHALNDVIGAFRREGCRILFVSAIAAIFVSTLALIATRIIIIAAIFPALLWPFLSGMTRGTNKKILVFWIASAIALASLPQFKVIGRNLSPGLITLGVLLNVTFFQFVYRSFKRENDLQSWIITAGVLCSSCRAWNDSFSSRLLSWGLLSFAGVGIFLLRGTLLEHHLKFHLLLLIPFQLLSIRHECIFHFALAALTFSWIFMENVPDEKTLLTYQPSMFSVEKPSEFSADKMQAKHYRQAAFFLVFCFVSFFAAGNLPSVYAYDLNIAKPFGDACAPLLILLKLFIPFSCLVFSFLILNYIQRREPATQFMLSLYFLDVFASCLLIYIYFLNDIFNFNVSHYVLLEVIVIAMTALYLLERHLLLKRIP